LGCQIYSVTQFVEPVALVGNFQIMVTVHSQTRAHEIAAESNL